MTGTVMRRLLLLLAALLLLPSMAFAQRGEVLDAVREPVGDT